jgi:hypothetical protein
VTHHYAPYYCEENVWWLAQDARFADRERDVVIISNARHTVAMHAQRDGRGRAVFWDYHVVLAVRAPSSWEVWDLDTTLGMPIDAARWLDGSFGFRTTDLIAPRFRLVPADTYIANLATDRRHMRDEHGAFREPPPPWPIIGGGAHDLDRWIDVHDTTYGEWIDLPALERRWR